MNGCVKFITGKAMCGFTWYESRKSNFKSSATWDSYSTLTDCEGVTVKEGGAMVKEGCNGRGRGVTVKEGCNGRGGV